MRRWWRLCSGKNLTPGTEKRTGRQGSIRKEPCYGGEGGYGRRTRGFEKCKNSNVNVFMLSFVRLFLRACVSPPCVVGSTRQIPRAQELGCVATGGVSRSHQDLPHTGHAREQQQPPFTSRKESGSPVRYIPRSRRRKTHSPAQLPPCRLLPHRRKQCYFLDQEDNPFGREESFLPGPNGASTTVAAPGDKNNTDKSNTREKETHAQAHSPQSTAHVLRPPSPSAGCGCPSRRRPRRRPRAPRRLRVVRILYRVVLPPLPATGSSTRCRPPTGTASSSFSSSPC